GPELANARRGVDELWQSPYPTMTLDSAIAEPLGAEITFQLALCWHEDAELKSRTQANTESWRAAAYWWETFLDKYPRSPAVSAARLWRARALEKLGDRTSAAALLQNLSGDLTPLEKTARLYLARQLTSKP